VRCKTGAQSEGCSKEIVQAVVVPWGDETFSLARAKSNLKKTPPQKMAPQCFDVKLSFGAVRANLTRNESRAGCVRPATPFTTSQSFNI
jgi:hypothetical protein